MGYRRQRLLIIKSGEGGGGAITQDAFASVAGAALNTGVGKTTDTLDLVALNDTTLRIMPAQEMFFVENFADGVPITEAMVSFPQLDYPLANLGLVADGTYLRYIGYDVDGVVQVGSANFFMNQSVAHLGFVLVKRVGGVTTFLDGAAGPRNVSSSPMMASSSLLERAYATTQSNVSVIPNVGAMTFAKSAGVIRGPSINWHGGANIHELPVAGQTPASFTRINPTSAASAALPAASTAFKCDTYWNGVASVAVPNPNNATVQRWLVGFKGGLWLQEGEAVYTNLADAVDAIYNAKFSTVYPSDTYAEVARTAAVKSTTDVNNNAQSVTVQTGHVGGSGSGAAGSGPVFAEALLGVTIAPNVVNASLNNLIPAGGILNVTGDLNVSGTINTFKSGAFFVEDAPTTSAVYSVTRNNGNTVRFGVENSVGSNQLPGSSAYDGFIVTASNGLSLGAFGTNILRLSSIGAEVQPGLTLKTGGGRVLTAILQAATPNTLDSTIHYFFSSAPGAAVVNLPPLATNFGREYWIKNVGGSTLTVAPNGADQIFLASGIASVVLTPGQWLHIIGGNAYWAEVGSSTGSGILILPASTTAFASMRVPHGVAPAAPVNGDIWTTTTGAFIQINGTTVQFGSTGTGGTDASTLTGATLAANVINASLQNITPASSLLTVGGHIKAFSFTATSGVAPILASTTVIDYPATYARLLGVGANPTTQGNIWFAVASSDATLYTQVAHITSSGLDVTGQVTATGGITTVDSFTVTSTSQAVVNFIKTTGTARSASIYNNGTLFGFYDNTGGADMLRYTYGSGLSVTGALGVTSTIIATGSVSAAAGGVVLAGTSVNPYIQLTDTGGASYVEVSGGTLRLVPRAGQSAAITASLAVTGAISATSDINLSRTGPGAAITWSDSARLSVPSGKSFGFSVNGGSSDAMTLSSAGLAVTGSVTSSGNGNFSNVGIPDTNWFYWGTGSTRIIGDSTGNSISLMTSATTRAFINATGLAVTGAISSTSTLTVGGGNAIITSGNLIMQSGIISVSHPTSPQITFDRAGSGVTIGSDAPGNIFFYSGATRAIISPAGLAVTGTSTATGIISSGTYVQALGNGVSMVISTGPGVGVVGTTTNHPVGVYVNSGQVASFSITGLAVAGSITATIGSASAIETIRLSNTQNAPDNGNAINWYNAGFSPVAGFLRVRRNSSAVSTVLELGVTADFTTTNATAIASISPTGLALSGIINYGAVPGNINPPTYSTRSAGTRIVLFSNLTASDTDFAIGIENNAIWQTVANGGSFKFYSGTNPIVVLNAGSCTISTPLGVTGDLVQSGAYHNFSSTQGAGGFGIRSNGGVMEFKNNGGGWVAIGGGGGGGSVTSVGITGNNGISVGSSPVTTSGNITLGLGDITPTSVDVSTIYKVQGVQVLTSRRAAINTSSIAAGGFTSADAGLLVSNFTAINSMLPPILVVLRAHGLIAP